MKPTGSIRKPLNGWLLLLRSELADMDFYLVTDSGLSRRGIIHDVGRALDAGCRVVQYREKKKDTHTMIEEATDIARLCRGRALFLVNDRIDVALAVDADGVHLGQDDMPYGHARRLLGSRKVIGLTTHDVPESVEAEQLGVDYIGLSPIFDTSTKEDVGKGCGTDMVRLVREAVSVPIVAIGGITLANAGSVVEAGADAVAAISVVVAADDVGREVRAFAGVVRKAKRNR
ncbi:thiamine phosphate synthase [Candidatus Latescibacterota bacterium]